MTKIWQWAMALLQLLLAGSVSVWLVASIHAYRALNTRDLRLKRYTAPMGVSVGGEIGSAWPLHVGSESYHAAFRRGKRQHGRGLLRLGCSVVAAVPHAKVQRRRQCRSSQ